LEYVKGRELWKDLSKNRNCLSEFDCSSLSELEKTAKLKNRKVCLKQILVTMGKDCLGYLPNMLKFKLRTA